MRDRDAPGGGEDAMPDHLHNEFHGAAEAMLKSIAQARSEHLTYEQMDAWVEDEMDQTAREWVVAHIGLCEFCAKQLAGYESYAQTMSGPIAAPAKLIPLGERMRAAFGWPQFAMAALAIVVVVLAPIVIKNARTFGSDTKALESLPPALRQAAESLVKTNTPLRPAVLTDVTPNVDPRVVYPAGEVIEDITPTLRWNADPANGTYTVGIVGENQSVKSEELSATQWTVPIELHRGGKYVWWVRSGDEVHQGSFRVLGASEEQTLAQLRASGAGPLAMGAVEEQFGLLTSAENEFEKLKSEEGSKLIHNVDSLLGKQ